MKGKVEIRGFCDERYLPVREAFAENFRRDLEVGASVAVTEAGRYVVDLWGGYADRATRRPWEEDTLVLVFSTTKIMTYLCALMLVDRGQLDLDAPVAKYWPGFAQAGKQRIPVRHVFSHATGLAAFEEPIPFTTLCDWERCVDLLAGQKPWWEPGTASGYHGLTQGFLLGELIRRISGQSVGSFFRTEVAEKLGADFWVGLPEAHRSRRARLSWGEDRFFDDVEPGSVAARYAENLRDPHWQSSACLSAEIPSVNGHGNARSVAGVGSSIALGGEVDGTRLLTRDTLDKALEEQIYTTDLVAGVPIRFGLGFALPSAEFPLPHPNAFHWGGYGGSFCLMDLDAGICCAYAMNHLQPGFRDDPRNERILQALFAVIT